MADSVKKMRLRIAAARKAAGEPPAGRPLWTFKVGLQGGKKCGHNGCQRTVYKFARCRQHQGE